MCFFLFLFARDRTGERASKRANALSRARSRAFLLIGKYRNARNIEHLDGTASMPLRIAGVPDGQGGQGEIEGVGHVGGWVWVWRRFFRRQASAVRAFSLNEFDGFREIGSGSGSGGLRPRDFSLT